MLQVPEKFIILKKIKHLENNLILHAISSQGCKVNLFARAAVKSKRRFGGGVLEPLNYIQAIYQPAKDSDHDGLAQLKEASLINSFPGLRDDYDRLEMAFYFTQLVSRVSQPGSVDGKTLFDLLGNGLKNAEVSNNLLILKLQFELKLLAVQGVLPYLADSEALLKNPFSNHQNLSLTSEQMRPLQAQLHHLIHGYVGSI